ncbi:TPA: helix-turn-helix transcriptional regulator [Clostridioides difficile]|uniref:helix-turn-helix domain-containing protein n=1 Tax=Clostridioides difficile TaxID=1496 RepID=UPI00093A50CF|nr:helix-turn-helix domain-containing protein [Clostridioides difficile]MBG0231996.1 helix-turn-helix transcriptional regulator [Clostridioides difficile]MBH7253739.1 helix-turn-helix transcriptional regulator [Clostridioides difficile]MBJ8657231.1 helix-turn-helix transcriptional regulator [Clostridioides difficile]MBN5990777.1 helix-turn-helix transcriptional regulator [Clostridioides difficile]MBY1941190.1 helix-turn-helix domain-containing protein [Clostridioides difficile]
MFGERLKELRLKKKLKQSELGKEIGISASTIGMYEQGRRFADQSTLIKLAQYFNVTTDYLLGFSKTNYSVNATIAGLSPIQEDEIITNESINETIKSKQKDVLIKKLYSESQKLNNNELEAIINIINIFNNKKEDD